MAVPVDAAATALSSTPQQIMSVGTSLVNAGKLRETPAGYVLVTGVTPEVSPAVATYLAGHLADAMAGAEADPRQVGRLLAAAGRYAGAWRTLSDAVLEGSSRYSDSEQIDLLETAFEALAEAKLDGGETEGRLRLRLARLYRNRGQTSAARTSLETAIPRLTGEDLVDALGFAASVEDDLQHPQEAERWVSLAELAATQANSPAKLGSLLTFHGRELSRLGFADEATATVAKGQALLEAHGSEIQRFYGRLNQAWIDLDQGQMRNAEIGFARLRDEAATKEGEASQADKEAYWARALYGVGRPVDALEAIERAEGLAAKVGAFAPVFISQLAAAEGGLLFEQWDVALEASDRALETALTSLPSWENVCRYLRARALAGRGSMDDARAEVEAALAATPAGSNGLRWRLRLEELQLELSDTWPQRQAEDLTDQLLQSRWLGAAADLMTIRSKREESPDLAAEAAALAMQLGNPVQAAKAITAGKLWQDPIALPVAAAMRSVVGRLPEGWALPFLDDPATQTVLATETEVGEEEVALLRERIDNALSAAGLSGEMILSPAQRRSAGLVRRRPVRRRRSPLALAGTAAAMAVIAVGAALAVVNLTAPPPTTTTLATTTTTVIEMEDVVVTTPATGILGSTVFRGDLGRSGVGTGGVGEASGHYWRNPAGPIIVRPPIAHGLYLLVPNDENIIQVIQQRSGVVEQEIQTENFGSPLASGEGGESGTIVVYVSDRGVLHAHSAFRGNQFWQQTVGEVVATPLVVGDSVYVATTEGRLLSFSLAGGQPNWVYPEGEPAGPFRSAPAFHEDTIYLASSDGLVHAVDVNTGLAACEPVDTRFEIGTNPMIVGDTLFMGTVGSSVLTYSVETCWGIPSGYTTYPVPTEEGAIATPDALYWVEGLNLHGVGLAPEGWLEGNTPFLWPHSFTDETLITTPPILANGLIYVGTGSGNVYAVNAETGEEEWRYRTGSRQIRHELLVVDGAVFATTADGRIIAIAGE
jgi:outer membrane protein assembly factor BamB